MQTDEEYDIEAQFPINKQNASSAISKSKSIAIIFITIFIVIGYYSTNSLLLTNNQRHLLTIDVPALIKDHQEAEEAAQSAAQKAEESAARSKPIYDRLQSDPFRINLQVTVGELMDATQYNYFEIQKYPEALNRYSKLGADGTRAKKGWTGGIAKKALWEKYAHKLNPTDIIEVTIAKNKVLSKEASPQEIQYVLEAARSAMYFNSESRRKQPPMIYRPHHLTIKHTPAAIGGANGYPDDPNYAGRTYWVDFADEDFAFTAPATMLTMEEWMFTEHPELEGLREILLDFNKIEEFIEESPEFACEYTIREDIQIKSGRTPEQINEIIKKNKDCYNWMGAGGSMVIKGVPQLFKLDLNSIGGYGYVFIQRYMRLKKIWDNPPEEFKEIITKWKQAQKNIGEFLWEHKIDLTEGHITGIQYKKGAFKDISGEKKKTNIIVLPAPSKIGAIQAARREKREEPGNEAKTELELDEIVNLQYTKDDAQEIFLTALQAFTMVQLQNLGQKVSIHTGNWGSGAFGNNRLMTIYMQMLAAETAGINQIYFHDPLRTCNSDKLLQNMKTHFGTLIFQGATGGKLTWDAFQEKLKPFAAKFQANEQTYNQDSWFSRYHGRDCQKIKSEIRGGGK